MTDWNGSEYARFADLQHMLGRVFADELPIQGHERVLDVGCGDGQVTALIAARVTAGSVLGIDPSPLMVEQATARAGGNLRFAAGDVLDLARDLATDGPFDLVVSLNALHWVPDLGRALAELRSVTAGRGRLVLQMVGASERRSLEQTAMDAASSSRWSDAFAGFQAPFIHVSAARLEQLAGGAGLRVTDSSSTENVFDFADRASFERWCTLGFGSWLERLPDAGAAEFVRDVVDRYSRASGSPTRFAFTQLRSVLVPSR